MQIRLRKKLPSFEGVFIEFFNGRPCVHSSRTDGWSEMGHMCVVYHTHFRSDSMPEYLGTGPPPMPSRRPIALMSLMKLYGFQEVKCISLCITQNFTLALLFLLLPLPPSLSLSNKFLPAPRVQTTSPRWILLRYGELTRSTETVWSAVTNG